MPATITTYEIIVTVLTVAALITTTYGSENPSLKTHKLTQSYDFPVGLLPEGVTHYDLDQATGKFNAYFKNFSIDNFYECPQCECGLKCKGVHRNAPKWNFISNPFASSI
ncbi:uncharacterized protein Fot_20173 [Forsythia ovata]|uniref:Uncharacterized protein n=1 Tax=Forsythia ovata TaxID=205694 RepID=A0ABD1VN49_9LAMI